MHAGDSAPASPLLSLIAGGTAGGIEAAVTYPFEYAKTRVQLKELGSKNASRNPFAVVADVWRKEGARALYMGCGPLVAGTIAKDAIRFMSFDSIKAAFRDPETQTLSPLRNLLAGMASGIVASTFAVTPTERLKTALIDDARGPRRFRSSWHATAELAREKGLQGLYRGYAATTAKQMGTTSVRLGSYNIMKEYGKKHDWPDNTAVDFAKGAVAGLVTTYATQPVDVVKTRAQSARGAGLVEATKSVWTDYGLRGFWRGTVLRLGRTVMAGGILFTSYEWVVRILGPVLEARS